MSLEDTLYPLLRVYEAAPQPVKSLVGRTYRAIPPRIRYGGTYETFARDAAGVERWEPRDIAKYQLEAVRQSLLAARQAPYYRERLQALGLDPERFTSLEQLREYPILTKQELLTHREDLVNPRWPASQRLHITTGGSSGVPVGFYLHKGVSRPKEQAYLEAQWARRGWRSGERTAVIRGIVTTSRAQGRISYYDATRNWLILSSSHLTIERLPEYVAALNRFRPRHLHAYPSAALMLARAMEQADVRLDFPLVSILCGSEKLSTEAQSYLEKFFGTRVLHWYGHSERVVLAAQGRGDSPHLYFWPTYGFVELGEPNAEGDREVIGTSFHNHVMPLIRYRTGDYVRVAQTPAREWPWLEIEKVVGRDYEFLVSATGRRVSLTTINMHDRIFEGLLAVQFYQELAGAVECRIQAGKDWHSSREGTIHEGLLRKLGDDFTLTLRRVDEMEKTKAGKHRWLVTRLNTQQALTPLS